MQASKHILSDELLHGFAKRCGAYDRDKDPTDVQRPVLNQPSSIGRSR